MYVYTYIYLYTTYSCVYLNKSMNDELLLTILVGLSSLLCRCFCCFFCLALRLTGYAAFVAVVVVYIIITATINCILIAMHSLCYFSSLCLLLQLTLRARPTYIASSMQNVFICACRQSYLTLRTYMKNTDMRRRI